MQVRGPPWRLLLIDTTTNPAWLFLGVAGSVWAKFGSWGS